MYILGELFVHYALIQVWSMFERMRGKLMDGFTTALVRDAGFLYSYFLWFEDSQVETYCTQIYAILHCSNTLTSQVHVCTT